jgi:hypothetical protein
VSSATQQAAAGIEFVLDRFDADDDRVVVEGRWSGITGRRFMRPVLQVHGERRLMAVLDHKPWAPVDGVSWTAAFVHDGPVGPARLQVAPDVAVELPAAGPDAGDPTPRPARVERPKVERFTFEPEPEAAVDLEPPPVRDEVVPVVPSEELDRVRDELDRARSEADRLRAEAERLRTELDRAQADADRFRTELNHVRAEANTLRPAHDESREKLAHLEADLARVRAEADRAVAERNAAHHEVERLRTPSREPYVHPRPITPGERKGRPDWRMRAVALLLILIVLVILIGLVSALF